MTKTLTAMYKRSGDTLSDVFVINWAADLDRFMDLEGKGFRCFPVVGTEDMSPEDVTKVTIMYVPESPMNDQVFLHEADSDWQFDLYKNSNVEHHRTSSPVKHLN